MNMFKKTIASLLLAAVVAGTAMPAYAAEFSDVSPDSPSHDAIMYCVENQIANGIGSGRFAPEAKISLTQFYSMALAAFKPEILAMKDNSLGWPQSINQLVVDQKISTVYEIENFQEKCSWLTVLRTIFDLEGITAYSQELWEDTPVLGNYNINDRALIATAWENGYFTGLEISDYHAIPTRGELAVLIYNAREHDIRVPDIVSKYKISFDDGGKDIEKSLAYEAMTQLPKDLLEQFYKEGWKLRVTNTAISELYLDYSEYGSAIGITDADRKEISVKGPLLLYGSHTILHEFGHYYAYVNDVSLSDSAFHAEKEALSKFFRDYAASSKDEAFSDLFAYMCQYSGRIEKMEALKAAVPQCYACMESILSKDICL